MEISVRRVQHGSPDYFEIVELRRRILRIPLGLDFDPTELDLEVDQIHLAAYLDNDLVGCLALVKKPGYMKMRQVAVDDERQRMGLGRMLVTESERIAKEEQCSLMELHARDTAVPFYEKLGYSADGPEFEEVGIPHRKMFKRLNP